VHQPSELTLHTLIIKCSPFPFFRSFQGIELITMFHARTPTWANLPITHIERPSIQGRSVLEIIDIPIIVQCPAKPHKLPFLTPPFKRYDVSILWRNTYEYARSAPARALRVSQVVGHWPSNVCVTYAMGYLMPSWSSFKATLAEKNSRSKSGAGLVSSCTRKILRNGWTEGNSTTNEAIACCWVR
jgi:hypothetical protein